MLDIELLSQNYHNILNKVKCAAKKAHRNFNDIKVLAVSKTQSANVLIKSADAGISIFAENYAQEFRDKYKQLFDSPNKLKKCEFHFIGHLQTNKVKYVVPNVSTIHTIDTIELANEVNKYAEKLNKTLNILIQINTSSETAKSGIEPEQCINFSQQLLQLKNLNLVGLMTIGTFSDNEKIIRNEFSTLRECLLNTNKTNGIKLTELSMGMSHDFEIAIDEGATMIRIGTSIFGERDYSKKN
jgi:pyridoxal phosphate enzyme (YggS family)